MITVYRRFGQQQIPGHTGLNEKKSVADRPANEARINLAINIPLLGENQSDQNNKTPPMG